MMHLAHVDGLQHGAVVIIAVASVLGYRWLDDRRPRRSRAGLVWWITGVGAMMSATSPPLERLSQQSFTGHMVQHLLIVVVAAPAFVMARPMRMLGVHVAGLRRVATWSRRWGWVGAPAAAVAVLYGTHLTGVYDAALSDRALHDAEHLAFLAAGIAVWWCATGVGASGRPRRLASALALIAAMAMLGMILSTAPRPLYAFYVERLGVEAALHDQRVGAAIMWVGGMALTLPVLAVSLWRWASFEERVQRARELGEAG